LQAHLLLIDDADARAVAEQCALTATGTLGILETVAAEGLIDLPGALALFQATTFHASKQLYQMLLDRDAARKGQ
jgi:predicted nucleic acid-binding protein